jgi:hypothetical protein
MASVDTQVPCFDENTLNKGFEGPKAKFSYTWTFNVGVG